MDIGVYFILDENDNVVEVDDPNEWARWHRSNHISVGNSCIGDSLITTNFVGRAEWTKSGPPLLFHTIITGGDHHGYKKSCATMAEAIEQHRKTIMIVNDCL